VITGDLGVAPGSEVTGFPPGTVSGIIHNADATAVQAKSDLVTAYNDAVGQSCDHNLSGQDLGGMTLTSGTYCFDSSAGLTGTLTLNAEGNPDAVFIFRIGSTLTTAADSEVSMINNGQACHVFWQIGSSATLGTTTRFKGNILALTSITANTGATFLGGLLARNGAVTLDTNTVAIATCGSTTTGGSTTTTGGSTTTTDNSTATSGSTTTSIKVTKKASDSNLRLGPKHVTFTYEVTNKGDVALSDVSVKDDKCHSVKFVSGDSNDDSKLDITEKWKYRCTKKVSETETNKVTAKGTAGDLKVHDHAEVTVKVHDTEKDTVPSLPNAGIGPEDTNSAPWNIIIPTSIFAVLFSFFLARKKLAI
jgi:hypothetical protein